MASNSREARRRKILEGGSKRLAFITGQTNGVPPSAPSDSQSHLRTDESLSDTIRPPDHLLTDRETVLTSRQVKLSDAAIRDNTDRAESLRPQKYVETLAEASPSEPRHTTRQRSPATSGAQTPSVVDFGASVAFTPLVNFVNAVTPKQVGAAIGASEYARMVSALVIALLVILSNLGFSSIGNIVTFRPVFLLLLTDATIVLGLILMNHHGDSSSAPRSGSGAVMNEQGIVDQVGNALEMVMMVKKIMDALLMDFSLYAVILICGLLFTRSIFA